MKSCFFIGHREATEDVLPALRLAIEDHINYGVTEFIVGNYGAFDRMAAHALLDAKSRYPQIILTLLTPYHPSERQVRLPNGFDNTFYPPGMENVPRRFAIVHANRYMIDHSDHLICYVWHAASNARNLLEHAERRAEIKIHNIYKNVNPN